MKNCSKCGAPGTSLERKRLSSYEDTVLGNAVVLMNVVDRVACNCGHSVDIVPDQEGLIAAVAVCRVMMPYKLNGREIGLLRKTLGLKGVEFARKLGVVPETLSRWENEAEVIGNAAEKLLRLTVAATLQPKTLGIDLDLSDLTTLEISPVRPANWPKMYFERVRIKRDGQKNTLWDTTTDKIAA